VHVLWAGALLVTVGVVVVALPDDDERLFSLTDEHGPSPVDAVGIALLLVGWVVLAWEVRRRRPEVSRRAAAAGAVATAIGTAVLAVAMATGSGAWVLGVALLAAPQVALVVAAARR
jgi:hypothetical protein